MIRSVEILAVIFPVFAIALLGYLLTWAGVFRTGDVAGLTRYVFNVALPVMLFDSMAAVALPESVQWTFLLAYYLPGLALFGAGMVAGRRWFGHRRGESGVYGMSCGYSNTVLIGIPVVSAAWGEQALLPLLLIITIHSAVFFSLTTLVVESGERHGTGVAVVRRTAAGMVRNPVVMGLAVGVLFNVAGWSIPGVVRSVTSPIRASALPAALFVTGASLRQYRPMGHLPEALTAMVMKLVVHPLLVWVAAAVVFRLDPLWTAVAVVTAALPTGINASVFAVKYDKAVAPVATAVLVGTALSIVSVTTLLVLLAPGVPGIPR